MKALRIFLFAIAITITTASAQTKRIKVLMVGGGTSHNFARWYRQADGETLRKDGFATVTYTSNVDSIIYYLPKADVLYLATNQDIPQEARKAIFSFAAAGKGMVLGHPAIWYNWPDWPEYNLQLVGGGSRSHEKYGAFEETVFDAKHPVTRGLPMTATVSDERYRYEADPQGIPIQVLVNSSVSTSDKIYPSVFIVKHPKTRVVGLALGHDAGSHDTEFYKTVLRNAVQWVAGK